MFGTPGGGGRFFASQASCAGHVLELESVDRLAPSTHITPALTLRVCWVLGNAPVFGTISIPATMGCVNLLGPEENCSKKARRSSSHGWRLTTWGPGLQSVTNSPRHCAPKSGPWGLGLGGGGGGGQKDCLGLPVARRGGRGAPRGLTDSPTGATNNFL